MHTADFLASQCNTRKTVNGIAWSYRSFIKLLSSGPEAMTFDLRSDGPDIVCGDGCHPVKDPGVRLFLLVEVIAPVRKLCYTVPWGNDDLDDRCEPSGQLQGRQYQSAWSS